MLTVLSKFAVTRVVGVTPDPGDPRATAANVPITATPTVAATLRLRSSFISPLPSRLESRRTPLPFLFGWLFGWRAAPSARRTGGAARPPEAPAPPPPLTSPSPRDRE